MDPSDRLPRWEFLIYENQTCDCQRYSVTVMVEPNSVILYGSWHDGLSKACYFTDSMLLNIYLP